MLLIIFALLFNSVFAINYCTLCKNGTHSMCRFKEGPAETCVNYTKLSLTSDEKMYILDIHNDIRNHVASGQETRGALGNQPAAADMSLLEWDDELATMAQRWVDQCITVNATTLHDKCRRTENFAVGQNVVTAIAPDLQLPELSVLILNWYKQIMYVIPSDIDEFTGIWRNKHQIGQYTQLVWAKTRIVGCAAAAFKETIGDPLYNIRFVCNYGPAGNVVGQAVYQRGKPCSGCSQKVCDRVRPNLCGELDKNVNIMKQNAVFKKYNDKATTLSNWIDIEDSKISTRIFNFSVFNIPEILNTSAELDKDLENLNVTTINNVFLTNTAVKNSENSTKMEENTYPIISSNIENNSVIFTTEKKTTNNNNLITENEGYYTIPSSSQNLTNYTDANPTKWINLTSIYEDFDNTTYFTNETSTTLSDYSDLNLHKTTSTKRSEKYKNNLKLKITFLASIELFMGSFFNESMKKPEPDDLIIDLTKNKCEGIKLHNGIILVQDCKNHLRKSINIGQKPHTKRKKILVKGNEVILPGNRRFIRATGVWHHGHCRCTRFIRSCSTNLNMTRSMLLLTSLALVFTINQR